MAVVKNARILSTEAIADGVRLLALEPTDPLGFVGGQYLIFDSGVLLPNGKAAKRAYSILSSDREQTRITIAVKRIGDGPASSFLHAQPAGTEVPFSGPWGKYLPDDARPRPTLIVATDTGITAALGLVRGAQFAPQRPHARLLWLLERDDYFLPPASVRGWAELPVEIERVPPVGHVERAEVACAVVERALSPTRPESVFLSGDGAVLHPLRERLALHGIGADRVRLESFFNNPEKKST